MSANWLQQGLACVLFAAFFKAERDEAGQMIAQTHHTIVLNA